MIRPPGTLLAMLVAAFGAGCAATKDPAAGADPVIAAAGDIAHWGGRHRETSDLLVDSVRIASPGTGSGGGDSVAFSSLAAVLTLGDSQYDSGALAEYERGYDPTWGRVKDRTYPAPGNHDYDGPDAEGYFEYWGSRAGPRGRGYYSFDVGEWHLISLNSEIDGGPLSPQVRWLKGDLAATEAKCVLAYWHQPRFSSGSHGSDDDYQTFWEVLYAASADVVLAGHDHDYERFAPMSPDGAPDPKRGVRQFVIGTGGVGQRPFQAILPQSEVRATGQWGVLKLTLRPFGYEWRFEPAAGSSFTDFGRADCH